MPALNRLITKRAIEDSLSRPSADSFGTRPAIPLRRGRPPGLRRNPPIKDRREAPLLAALTELNRLRDELNKLGQ